MSSAAALDIPTRHSLKQPPRVCSDPVELKEDTARLLEVPLGKLYADRATADGDIEEAYHLAYSTIAKAEYLMFGHASQIVGSMYAGEGGGSTASPEDIVCLSMKPLIARLQQEGEIYMQLRHEKRVSQADVGDAFTPGSAAGEDLSADEQGYLSSSEDDSSSSSSSSDDDSDEERENSHKSSKAAYDFSPPGPTSKMQESLLDAMACVGKSAPSEYYEVALEIIGASDLDKGSNAYTQPSHVTFNAALRGIATSDLSNEMVRDDALSSAFSLYNHLTHSLHLPRNAMTYVYMFQIIEKGFPASRVRGNISCTLWDHASRQGVVNEKVIEALKSVHASTNGPEFQSLLDHISGPLPQKYRRFVNKFRHSSNY